ncbi:PRC-barrel domain-containing protein [Devosia pacifica]|nr:PRC-barrel domain-containing protein [Devosia pacifica]
MIRTLLTTTAIAALLGSAAIAQDAPAVDTEAPMNEMEAPAEGMEPMDDAAAPEEGEDAMAPADGELTTEGGAMAPAEGDDAMAPAEGDDAMAPAEGDAMAPAEGDDAMAVEGEEILSEDQELNTDAPEDEMVDEPWDVSQGYTAADSDNLISEMLGMPVYSSAADDAENIGDINDLVFTADGQLEAVVIGVGGFLGIGEKQVAADFELLNFTIAADNTERWVLETNAEALEGAPEFVWAEDQPVDPAGAMAPADGGAMAPADPAGAMAPADGAMAPAEGGAMAPADGGAMAPAEGDMAPAEQPAQ